MNIVDRLNAARARVSEKNAYFASVLADRIFTPGTTETISVTGNMHDSHVYYGDEISKLSDSELDYTLVFIASLSDSLMQRRQRGQLWDMACNYAINSAIVKENIGTMPKNVLYAPDYENMTAEEIYDLLLKTNIPTQDVV